MTERSPHPEQARPERMPRGGASLEVLRAEAHQELDTVIEERLLGGEDPWNFMEELPSVDEMAVYLLRPDEHTAHAGVLPSPTRAIHLTRTHALAQPLPSPAL